MAVAPVSLGPGLHAWSLAGLSHILCDGPVDSVFCNAEASPARPMSPPQRKPPLPAASPGVSSGGSPSVSIGARPHPPTGEPSANAGEKRPQQEPAQAMTGFAVTDSRAVDSNTWPEAWKNWFARITPAPVVWSYHELGADLTGIGRSPERSDFFKKLLGELGLPKGSSVFWPSAMPLAAEGETAMLEPHPVVFSAGLSKLNPQVVIVFGETALDDMGLAGHIRPFRQEMVDGKLVLCLPEIDVLLRNQGQRASSVSLLRTVLALITPLP